MEQKISKLAKVVATAARKVKAGYSNNPNYFGDWFGKGQIDFSKIINPNDSGDVYMVKIWGGSGYVLDVYLVKADDYQDAIDKVFEWSYKNEGKNKIIFDYDYVLKDAKEMFAEDNTMYGKAIEDEQEFIDSFIDEYYMANSNYDLYAMSENFVVTEVPEEYLKGNKESSKKSNLSKKAEEIEPGSIYEKAKAILPKEDIDHHETDLYLRVSPKSTELVNSMKYKNSGMITTFKDNIDGDMWYELPFCYPFIERGIPSKEEDEIILRQKKSSKRVKLTKKAIKLNPVYFENNGNSKMQDELKMIDDLRKQIVEESNIREIKNLAQAIITAVDEYKRLLAEKNNKK